jgi:hypothetical protein
VMNRCRPSSYLLTRGRKKDKHISGGGKPMEPKVPYEIAIRGQVRRASLPGVHALFKLIIAVPLRFGHDELLAVIEEVWGPDEFGQKFPEREYKAVVESILQSRDALAARGK